MRIVLILTILLTFISLIDFVFVTAIVGGFKPNNCDQFKFAVSLLYRNLSYGTVKYKHFCGGTYLKGGWVLTAAHCVSPLAKESIVVVVGERNIKNYEGPFYNITKIKAKNYNKVTYGDDIALIKLDSSFYGEPLVPEDVELQSEPLQLSRDLNKCYIFGYGSEEFTGAATLELRIGFIDIITQEQCEEDLGKYMAPERGSGMFCAIGNSSSGLVDACQGDSGGSLICKSESISNKYHVVGITSYGAGCGAPNKPGVYTCVQSHIEWINEVMNEM